MKQSTEKYISVWYINVGNVSPNNVPGYIDAAKKAFGDLDDFLGRETNRTFFVPVRNKETRLEIFSLGNAKKLTPKRAATIVKGLNKQQTELFERFTGNDEQKI
jgi:hypothetical protein